MSWNNDFFYLEYASKDESAARQLMAYLDARGISLRSRSAGAPPTEALAMISCFGSMIVLLSPALAASGESTFIYKTAISRYSCKVFLVLVDGSEELFELFPQSAARFDLRSGSRDAVNALAAALLDYDDDELCENVNISNAADFGHAQPESSDADDVFYNLRPSISSNDGGAGFIIPDYLDEFPSYTEKTASSDIDEYNISDYSAPRPTSPRQPETDEPFAPLAPLAPRPKEGKKPVAAKEELPEIVDRCDFSVVSPNKVLRGGCSHADIYMYTKAQRYIVDHALARSPQSSEKDTVEDIKVKQGVTVSAVLECEVQGVVLNNWLQSYVWDGEYKRFSFGYSVSPDFAGRQIPFVCYIKFDNFDRFELRFTVDVAKSARAVSVAQSRIKKIKAKVIRLRMAFVSYSHKDIPHVYRWLSVKSKKEPTTVFWMDSQSLEAGERWRDEIRRAIDASDLFLLFWSRAASESDEVEHEWRYALKKKLKGKKFITPVPLTTPQECPPPKELGHLHFGRPEFNYSRELEGVSFVKAKNVKYLSTIKK